MTHATTTVRRCVAVGRMTPGGWEIETEPGFAMQWTTTPPTRPGWYWIWHEGFQYIYEVCTLDRNIGHRELKAGDLIIDGDEGAFAINDLGWYWAGPIDVPAPPITEAHNG